MATFAYTARTKSGEKIEGVVDAADRRAALSRIESMGQIPVSVTDKVAAAGGKKGIHFTWRGKHENMGTRDVLTFTTELSDLLASGMTLGSALNSLARRRTGRTGDTVISGLRDGIIQGASLSEALARFPRTFPKLYVNMIRAGEASGALDEILRRLVTHFERIQDTKEKVVMALVYPMIVMILGAATLVFSMLYVVPKFKAIFENMGEALPLPTRILIGSSTWLAKYGWAALIVIGIVVVLINRTIQTPRGRLAWDGFRLRIPMVKGILASSVYANFARTLGTLLANGVPVLQALGIVENTVGNAVISAEIHNARDRVTDGTSISGPLAAGKVMPEIMTDMLAVGEQTGDMPGALEHIARRYENELDRNVKIFTTALEPILIVLVAVMVGFVAISILMAVFNLTSGLNV